MLSKALLSGSVASVLSTFALALRGHREIADPAAPLNGPSQWLWGRHAKYKDGFTLRHTLVGYAIHHAASVFWALLYERLRRSRPEIQAAAMTSATAAFVDYRLTPKRLRPGFEKRISTRSLVLVYVAFGLGLAVASRISERLAAIGAPTGSSTPENDNAPQEPGIR